MLRMPLPVVVVLVVVVVVVVVVAVAVAAATSAPGIRHHSSHVLNYIHFCDGQDCKF